MAIEDRLGELQVVAIAVVERDQNGSGGQRDARANVRENVIERNYAISLSEQPLMALEGFRADDQRGRVGGDPVIHENAQRPRTIVDEPAESGKPPHADERSVQTPLQRLRARVDKKHVRQLTASRPICESRVERLPPPE